MQYGDAFVLMDELKGMGESNASVRRRQPPSRRTRCRRRRRRLPAAAESLGLAADDPALTAYASGAAWPPRGRRRGGEARRCRN